SDLPGCHGGSRIGRRSRSRLGHYPIVTGVVAGYPSCPASAWSFFSFSDLGLGASGGLAPDPRTVRTPAERDGTNPGAVRRISVDRAFAVPTARSSRHTPDSTPLWLLVWLCSKGL